MTKEEQLKALNKEWAKEQEWIEKLHPDSFLMLGHHIKKQEEIEKKIKALENEQA